MRRHLTYANVVATLALFVALGGSGYAAIKVTSKSIKNRTIREVDVRRDALGGRVIRESRLGEVPRAGVADSATRAGIAGSAGTAANADKVDGLDASALRLRCPGGTVLAVGVCIEPVPRSANATLFEKQNTCAAANRRLASFAELRGAYIAGKIPAPTSPEFTSDLFNTSSDVLFSIAVGAGDLIDDGGAGNTQQTDFRCVTSPSN